MVFASFGAQRANLTANASELADIRGTALELVRELAHALNLDSKVLSSMLERFVLVASCDQNVARGRLQHLTGKADALGGSDDRGGSHVAVPPFPWATKSPYDLPGWRASHARRGSRAICGALHRAPACVQRSRAPVERPGRSWRGIQLRPERLSSAPRSPVLGFAGRPARLRAQSVDRAADYEPQADCGTGVRHIGSGRTTERARDPADHKFKTPILAARRPTAPGRPPRGRRRDRRRPQNARPCPRAPSKRLRARA